MRRALAAALATGAALAIAPAAEAIPPSPISVDPPVRVVQDSGQACGFPVRWTIDITSVEGATYFDNDGRPVFQRVHIKEENTITNLATGLTLREGPDSFTQTIRFNPDGTIREVIATGLAANVFGTGVRDVGRVVWQPGSNEIVFSAGPHPVREAMEFGAFEDALGAFCEVLAP